MQLQDSGLANSDLPKRSETFKKVCLTAFAESEFGNPFYKGRSPIMGWQIPICQKGRSPLKKYALRHLPNRNSATHFFLPNRNSATHSMRKSSVGTTRTNDGFQTGEKIAMLMSSSTLTNDEDFVFPVGEYSPE